MIIEKIEVVKTLKAGEKIWVKGTVLSGPPFDPIILNEIRMKTTAIKILSLREEPKVEGASTISTLLVRSTSAPVIEDPIKEIPSVEERKEEPVLRPRKVNRG